MSFVAPITILDRLKLIIEGLDHPTAEDTRLFQLAAFHVNKKLREALQQLFSVDDRVCIIVPGGFNYTHVREGRVIRSSRTFEFDLLIADRTYDATAAQAAQTGGDDILGVLAMAEVVVEELVTNPQLAVDPPEGSPEGTPRVPLPWVVITIDEAAEITLSDEDTKDSPGRQCYVIHCTTPAGEVVLDPTLPWEDS